MGDVLPPKRQTGVERLKRRFELYRRHKNACLPRYEQAESGLYEIQRQETLLLKQRYLESKAKKAKSNKGEHHRSYKESVTDSCKSQVHTKPLKRPAEEPLPNPSIECSNNEDAEKPPKLLRTDITSDKLSELQTQQQSSKQPQSSLPSFSLQIVQQFTNTPHSQQSQTLQTNVTVQALNKPLSSPIPQPSSNKSSQEPVVNVTESQQVNSQLLATIECKQENDSNQSDLCQFKNAQNTTSDRLSDTFPSLGFTDESGDDVIHPDLLKDLIDDVFTNPADIMKDFNFDDSVGSMKDQDDDTKDIISDLIKQSSPMPIRPFQTDNLQFVNNSISQQSQQQQQPQQQKQQPPPPSQPNGLFKSMSSSNEVPVSVIITTTPTSTTSNFYSTASQRLPSYGNSSLSLPTGLSLDFKINEPSPAALTLKQMAEQHQNMQQKHQQQQLVNSALNSRPFNQDAFNPHMNQLRSTTNYLPGTNSTLSSPKTPNSNHMFSAFDRQMNSINSFANNEPLNNLPISPNNIFDSRTSGVLSDIEHSKQPNCVPVQQQQIHHQQQQHQHIQQQDHHQQQLHQKQPPQQQQQQQQQQQSQKPPAYPSPRQLPHFSESSQLRLQNPVTNQHQPRPMARQFPNSMQMVQTQMHSSQRHLGVQQMPSNSHNVSQQQHHMMPHSAQYTNFSSQQSLNNPTFHVSMSSQNMSYSPQFNSSNQAMNSLHHANRPPPEYKAHQSVDNVNIIDQLKVSSPQVMFNHSTHKDNLLNKHQRPPNVTITADGSVIRTSSALDWRHMINEQQNRGNPTFRGNYNNNFGKSEHPVQQPQMFNQYRLQDSQMVSNRLIRPNRVPNQMFMQQRPRISAPQRPRNQSPLEQHSSVGITNNSTLTALSSSFSNRHDINRSDGMLSLDFLDNIESSASDLLNFDQVIQEGATNFPLLDDMEILGK